MLDVLAAAADLQAQADKAAKEAEENRLKDAKIKQVKLHKQLMKEIHKNYNLEHKIQSQEIQRWTVEKIKDKMKYYTGFDVANFYKIFKLLVPTDEFPFNQNEKRKAYDDLTLEQQFLLVMMKLRQNFDFVHLAGIFVISQNDAGAIFREWINYMFFKFGEIPTWPDREILIEKMPTSFKADFPTTVAILDGTEIKSEKPSSLKNQSQFYSDYKSSTTLKGLVATDPKGSFIFISMLFSGSISDKEICEKSGLMKQLKLLIEKGKLLPGDGIMVDKGFHIAKEIKEMGLKLWIPPFASAEAQMSAGDVSQTKKIAKHRIIVENAIGRAKSFKILKHTINLSLFPSINQIWFCCCFLTNFMPCLRK